MLKATVKRVIFPIAKRTVKIYYHNRKVPLAKIRRTIHGNSSHIINPHTGDLRHEGGKYALFLIWQPKKVAWYIDNTIIIANHALSTDQLSYLKQLSHTILIRDNTGFDIGGYRDATLHLANSGTKPERVIYMNDSVYYFKEGLTDLFRRLKNSKSDICGTFENWEFYYHIQSFCFSVSGKLFLHSQFQKFWNNYLPVNSRLWAIQQGEVGIAQAVIKICDNIDIVYRAKDLKSHLLALDEETLLDVSRQQCRPVRISPDAFKEAHRITIANDILERTTRRSQIHTSGFLYKKFLGSPLVKRDIVFKLEFSLDEVEEFLHDHATIDNIDSIMSDLRKKGRCDHLGLLDRLKLANALI